MMDLQKEGLEYLHAAEDGLTIEPTDEHHRKTQRAVTHLQLHLASTYFLATIASCLSELNARQNPVVHAVSHVRIVDETDPPEGLK